MRRAVSFEIEGDNKKLQSAKETTDQLKHDQETAIKEYCSRKRTFICGRPKDQMELKILVGRGIDSFTLDLELNILDGIKKKVRCHVLCEDFNSSRVEARWEPKSLPSHGSNL